MIKFSEEGTRIVGELVVPKVKEPGCFVIRCSCDLGELRKALYKPHEKPGVITGISFGRILRKTGRIAKRVAKNKITKHLAKEAAKMTPAGAALQSAYSTYEMARTGNPRAKRKIRAVEKKAKAGDKVAQTDMMTLRAARNMSHAAREIGEAEDREAAARREEQNMRWRGRYQHGVQAPYVSNWGKPKLSDEDAMVRALSGIMGEHEAHKVATEIDLIGATQYQDYEGDYAHGRGGSTSHRQTRYSNRDVQVWQPNISGSVSHHLSRYQNRDIAMPGNTGYESYRNRADYPED